MRVDIDLDAEGRTDGRLIIPVTTERAPFGIVEVPVASIRRSAGPRVLLMAGCHGDEREGQIALRRLLRELDPEMVSGQLIILPAANAPAANAGTRLSPIDGGNLNRAMPGDHQGDPTARIARWLADVIPTCDLVIDLHGGGLPIEYLPSAMIATVADEALNRRTCTLAEAMALPVTFFVDPADDAPSSILGYCASVGVPNLSVEIGGGAAISGEHVVTLLAALRRALNAVAAVASGKGTHVASTMFCRRLPAAQAVIAPASGLFEPRVALGAQVRSGDLLAEIHVIDAAESAPIPVLAPLPGIILCRRVTTTTFRGEGLFRLGQSV